MNSINTYPRDFGWCPWITLLLAVLLLVACGSEGDFREPRVLNCPPGSSASRVESNATVCLALRAEDAALQKLWFEELRSFGSSVLVGEVLLPSLMTPEELASVLGNAHDIRVVSYSVLSTSTSQDLELDVVDGSDLGEADAAVRSSLHYEMKLTEESQRRRKLEDLSTALEGGRLAIYGFRIRGSGQAILSMWLTYPAFIRAVHGQGESSAAVWPIILPQQPLSRESGQPN